MTQGRRFVVVAILWATGLIVAVNLVAAQLDAPINWITSTATAVVVGLFLALLLLGRKKNAADAEGFDIEGVRERRE